MLRENKEGQSLPARQLMGRITEVSGSRGKGKQMPPMASLGLGQLGVQLGNQALIEVRAGRSSCEKSG